MADARHHAALTATLESVITRAISITMGTDATTDASALLDESNALWLEIADAPSDMLPVVTTLASTLAAQLEDAPDRVKRELLAYREATAAARFDWIEPPRSVVAFMILDALERIRDLCASKPRRDAHGSSRSVPERETN